MPNNGNRTIIQFTNTGNNGGIITVVTVTMQLGEIRALLEEGGQRNLRVSVGVETEDIEPFVLHRMESVDGVVDAWSYRIPLRWPVGPATLCVVVEDLGSATWGGAVTDLQ